MRKAYVEAITEEALKDKRIFQLVADIGTFTFDKYRETCSDRFLNVGIQEASMVGVAAGLAMNGKIPFIYTIAPFLSGRSFEPIRINICYQELNVKVIGCGSGYRYSTLGGAHHATDDITLMRALPGMTVISPADTMDVKNAVKAAVTHQGPMYIRIGRDGEPKINPDDYNFEIGKGVTVKNGEDFTIIGTGTVLKNILSAYELLKNNGIEAKIINMHTVKPLDKEIIIESAKETNGMITVEEHTIIGGLGSAVSEVLAEEGISIPFKRLGLNDFFCRNYGTPEYLDEICGLTAGDIAKTVKKLLED